MIIIIGGLILAYILKFDYYSNFINDFTEEIF